MTTTKRLVKEWDFGEPNGVFGGWVHVYEVGELLRVEISYPPSIPASDREPAFQPPTLEISRSHFSTDEELEIWLAALHGHFDASWKRVMAVEVAIHLQDCTHLALGDLNLVPLDLRTIADSHSKASLDNLKLRLGLPVGAGHRSVWTKAELTAAIYRILEEKKQTWTWDTINRAIAQKYPGREQKSGESLRVLASRHKISLRVLKAKTSKTKTKGR